MPKKNNSLDAADRTRIELSSAVDQHKTEASFFQGLAVAGISTGIALAVVYFNAGDDTSANGFFYGSMLGIALALVSLWGMLSARHKLRRDRAKLLEAEAAYGVLERHSKSKKKRWWRRD